LRRTKLGDEKLVKSKARRRRNVHQGRCVRQDHGTLGRFEEKPKLGQWLRGGCS
jgi:hypothetical protein